VCRELTKLHETISRGPLGALAALAREGTIPARGEFVLVVGTADVPAAPGSLEDAESVARAEVERLVADGVARGEAARRVAAETGIGRRRLYGGGR
jgi:16S rRNA (cytidine1402-2'-O)-methyltransferase